MCKNNIKNIIITGASSGLGKALAIEYANKDTTLFLTGRNQSRLCITANACIKKGAKVFYKPINIKDREKLKNWINDINNDYRIDLVIANCGISGGTSKQNIENSEQVYDIFDTNIYGVLNTILPVINIMKKQKSGNIAIISSMASFLPLPSSPSYSATKVCIRYFGESLYNNLKNDNIHVSIICPGFIKTPLTDRNNFKMPFLMEVEKASKIIKNGIEKNKKLIIFPKIMYFLSKLIDILPNFIKDFILSKLPKKN